MSSIQSMTLYRGSNGQPLTIRGSNVIGSGGEGSVYTMGEFPDLVAKVYHRPNQDTGAKLRLMVASPPTMPMGDGHISIAWPLDTLHWARRSDGVSVVGYLMKRIDSLQPVSQCYNPDDRRRYFPHFTFKHLCAVSINIAIAVGAIHGQNYVIGDINESNILVNGNGLVTLIDTDSFQVTDQERGTTRIFRSPVGKPEYTPPELQGRDFGAVDRDQHHDSFGLGVLIYQLMMEGLHPYMGRYMGPGDPPSIGRKIRLGHFLHSRKRSVPMQDGPGYMRWNTLDRSVADLFMLCFDGGHDRRFVRPTPYQWEEVITQSLGSFIRCGRNPNHQHFGNNRSCPWCERMTRLGLSDPYPARSGPAPFIMRRANSQRGGGRPPRPSPPPQAPPSPTRQARSPSSAPNQGIPTRSADIPIMGFNLSRKTAVIILIVTGVILGPTALDVLEALVGAIVSTIEGITTFFWSVANAIEGVIAFFWSVVNAIESASIFVFGIVEEAITFFSN